MKLKGNVIKLKDEYIHCNTFIHVTLQGEQTPCITFFPEKYNLLALIIQEQLTLSEEVKILSQKIKALSLMDTQIKIAVDEIRENVTNKKLVQRASIEVLGEYDNKMLFIKEDDFIIEKLKLYNEIELLRLLKSRYPSYGSNSLRLCTQNECLVIKKKSSFIYSCLNNNAFFTIPTSIILTFLEEWANLLHYFENGLIPNIITGTNKDKKVIVPRSAVKDSYLDKL